VDRSTKEAWLGGSDLRTAVVEDVPVPGQSVLVRGLPAAYSNRASSEAMKYITGAKGESIAVVDTEKMEVIQFAFGVQEPTFSVPEAQVVAEKFGPAFKKVIAKIDELSGVDKQAIEDANARFQPGGESSARGDVAEANGSGDVGPDLRVRAGVGAGDVAG
jgi:hypothetical protein